MPDFILQIKQRFPQDTWPWLLRALRQEASYWSALQDEFGLYVIEKSNGLAEDFDPASVCLLALGYPDEPATLRSPELPPAEQVAPPGQASRLDRPRPAPALAKASYLALQLREQHRASANWQHLQENRQAIRPLTLACLFGMLPRPVEMLAEASAVFPAEVIAQVFLAQPLPPTRQGQQIQAYLDYLPAPRRLEIARQIDLRLPGLITRLVPALLAERQPLAASAHPHLEAWQPEIANHLELADLYAFTGDHRQTVGQISEAIKLTRRLQARLAARMASAAQSEADMQTRLNAWELAIHLDPMTPAYLGGLVSAHLAAGHVEEARQRLAEGLPALPEDSENHPTLEIARARLALQAGELSEARRRAGAALAAAQEALPPAAEDEITWHAQQELPGLLLDLGLPGQAIQAAQLALQSQPVNIPLLVILGRAYQASGEYGAAQAAFHLATGLDPQDRELQRLLAGALEAGQDWVPALETREALVATAINPPLADLHALASCALHAQQPQRAAEVCQIALELESGHGLTHALLGEATAGRGETLSALEYLKTVTQNYPDEPQPWLALAKIYQQAGQSNKGLEVLRAAATTLPDHAGILLALGEACLQNNAPTEALPVLQGAARLSTGSTLLTPKDVPWRVGLYLGKTLQQLGHLQQACQHLEATWAAAPYDPEAAFAYATCLLGLHEYAGALAPLSIYLEREPAEIEPYLQYARAVLAILPQANRDQFNQTAIYLRQAREIDPLNPESAALLAEVLFHNNDLPAALEMYRLALDSPLIQEPDWRIRLNHGFGLTALQMGQIEAALAALQEAAQVDPHNPRMQRALCEAYEAAGLDEEAMAAARQALQLAPSDLDNLLWFANQMQSAGRRPGIDPEGARQEAIRALKQASELAPENAGILIHLSQLQISSQDFTAARQTLLALLNGDQGVQPSASQLQQAAANFLQLGEAAEAVRCLERAWELTATNEHQESIRRIELITALASARQQTGDITGALAAIEQALELAPRETGLYLQKANLLISLASGQDEHSELVLEKTHQALQALEKAVEIDPQNPATHLQAARLQRALGDLPTALSHAERAVRLFQQRISPHSKPKSSALPGILTSDQHSFSIRTGHQVVGPGTAPGGEYLPAEVSARLLAADLAGAMLEYAQAQEILTARLSLDEGDLSEHCVYFCMRAELAIAAGEFSEAIEQFINALELAPEHPRVLALQARLMARQLVSLDNLPGTALAAGPRQLLHLARQQLPGKDSATPSQATWLENDLPATSTWLALAAAGLELRQWEAALELSRASMANALHEPRAPLAVAETLILRAEYQRYAQALGMQHATPGASALASENTGACQEALEWAEQSLLQLHQPAAVAQAKHPASLEHVRRWKLRAEAIFEPSPENAQALAEKAAGPEDTWALLLCLEQIGDLSAAGRAAQAYPHLPFILAHLAHLLSASKPLQALAAIQAAYEILLAVGPASTNEPTEGDVPRCLHATDLALIHAQMGRLLQQHSRQPADLENAYRHLNLALEDAPQESRWQLWAAEIALQLAEIDGEASLQAAARHLEHAIDSDPAQPEPYHLLGELYLQQGNLALAADRLEQACELNAEDASNWLLLAQVYQQMGDTSQAAARAERAVTLAPNQVEPLLLRGQIALAEENPKGAQNRAQAALRLDPNHSEALCLLARALQAQGQTEEALESLEMALPASSNPLPLHLERIHLLHQTSGAEAALHAVQELGLAYPDAPARLALEIALLEETGHPQAAIQTAQMALRNQAEGLPAELSVDLHFRLGRLLGAAGQLDQSLHHLDQALQINPYHVEALLETGRVHQQRRQHALALKAYHKAIAAAPNDHRAYYQAGLALKDSKDYLEAEKMLRRAGELAPEDVGIHRLLGAVVALNLVHNREPSHPEISSLFDGR